MGSKPVQTEEGNVEGKCKKFLRKTIPTDLLNLKVGKRIQSIVKDSDRKEQLRLFGNNVRMQRDGIDAEDGSVSRMRLLVGTVNCEGKSDACSRNSYDNGVKHEVGNIGITGMVQKSDAVSVGMADDVGMLLVATVPSSMKKKKSGRVFKSENASPGLKQNLKQSSSKFGKEVWDRNVRDGISTSRKEVSIGWREAFQKRKIKNKRAGGY